MIQEWLLELAKGAGKLLLNPVFYYLFFAAALLGVSRVKRERRNFHIRVENAYFELRQLVPAGLAAGLVLSVITLGTGMVIPIELVWLTAAFTILWSLTGRIRLLAPAYTVGAAFFASIYIIDRGFSIPLIEAAGNWTDDMLFPAGASLLALLMIGEAVLILRNGGRATSPKLIKSKRGQTIGVHETKRLWLLPLFLLVPGDAISAMFGWWPLFSIGDSSYSIIFVPFSVGFHQQVQGMLPDSAVKRTGRRLLVFSVVLLLLSAAGYWYPLASIVITALAVLGREFITYRQKVYDRNQPFFFSRRNEGLVVLGVKPGTPAESMGLKTGELVSKVNGLKVQDENELYNALQRNGAHCKLEVFDVNGQIRFVQKALYEGDHHELGILFVQDEWKKDERAV
ncbi:PDZ domain-containing protein [Bacillus infantis]|uniref:PDZ domain-containing protein n=1 Tax=Bacillus infantis TaxID=324767 RepID=UPI003CFB86E1